MKTYFLLRNEDYIEINWGEALKKERSISHIGCKLEKGSRKIGEIVYRAASFCLGPKEPTQDREGDIKISCRDRFSSNPNKGERSYEVEFYKSFSVRFEVKGTGVNVFHHPDADVEILVDDVFQMALSELVQHLSGWLFHASAVGYGKQGLLLIGKSGSGKSTACLSLLLGGFSLLGDDTSLVIPNNGCYWAVPMAREVSVRLRALSLFQNPHQIVLHPIGQRFFWRDQNPAPYSLPLKIISFMEIEGGEETYLEEVSSHEFYDFFKHKPPFHGFHRDIFKECVEGLALAGIRFVRGRLGISPQSIHAAYKSCLEDIGRGHWERRGNRRMITLDEGRKLVAKKWAESKSIALQEIIPLLAHPSEGLAKSAHVVLAEEPLSYLEPIPWEDYEELWDPDEENSEEIPWCRVREWKAGIRGLLKAADWRFVAQNAEKWLRVAPVMYPFLRHYSQNHPQLQLIIDSEWRKYLRWKYPPQLIICLTDHCQLRRPYCYAEDKVRQGNRVLAWEKVEPLLDWAREKNLSSISLTGGEPTLYPWFPELVKAIRRREFPLYFATNLLFPASFRSWVEGVVSLEIHLCDLQDYSSSNLRMLEENLDWLRKQTFSKIFRYKLWRRQPSDWESITETVVRFGNGDFAFAVPFPSPTRQNFNLRRSELEEFSKVVMEFSQFCEKKGIHAVAAKPFPLCAFSEEEASYLLKRGALRGTCEIGASGRMRNLVIDPQLQVFPCVALDRSPGSNMTFPPQDQLMERLKRMVRKFLEKVYYERCSRCELRTWKICTGVVLPITAL